MFRRSKRTFWTLPLASFFLLTGCFSTELPPLDPPSGLEKLLQVSDTTIPVHVETAGFQENTVGYQYLFMFFPLARVYVPTVASDIRLQLSIAGGLRGYRFVDNKSTPNVARALELTIRDVNVDGYDLLVVRKPTASVTIHARLLERGAVIRECEESFQASSTAHYAFSAELQHALGEALLQSSNKLLDCLGFVEHHS